MAREARLNDPIAEQAIRWMVVLQSGNVSLRDEDAFARWRSSDPRCEAAWQKLNGSLGAFRTTAEERLPAGTLAQGVLASAVRRRTVLKACLALGAAGAGGLAVVDRFLPVRDLLADLRTDTAQRRSYVLADGSTAVLDARSAADVAITPEQRSLSLRDGAMLVSVSPGQPRPLVVRAAGLFVASTDGAFMVRRTPTLGAVSVVRASAQVATGDQDPLLLTAGQSVAFDGRTLLQEVVDVDAETAWTDGLLVVNDRPLAYVVDALRRYYPGIIRLDPALAPLRATGVYPLGDPHRALEALAQTLPIALRWFTPYLVSLTTPA